MPRSLVRALLVAPTLAALTFTACLDDVITEHGSGELRTHKYGVGEFTSLVLHRGLQVEVTIDPTAMPGVTVTMDDNLFEFLEVGGFFDELILDASRNLNPSDDSLIEVTMGTLEGVVVSGAANVNVTGLVDADDVELRASGASRIRLDELVTGTLELAASGASRITVESGTAGELHARASGASVFDLEGLEVDGDVDVDLSGASHIDVQGTGSVSGEASGASSIVVHGDPSLVDVSTSGVSSVRVED